MASTYAAVPAPPTSSGPNSNRPQQQQQRGAHRSGQNVFVRPPPPSNFFASAYRTNTVADALPPSLVASQSEEARLAMLLQSPRGFAKGSGVAGATAMLRTQSPRVDGHGDDDEGSTLLLSGSGTPRSFVFRSQNGEKGGDKESIKSGGRGAIPPLAPSELHGTAGEGGRRIPRPPSVSSASAPHSSAEPSPTTGEAAATGSVDETTDFATNFRLAKDSAEQRRLLISQQFRSQLEKMTPTSTPRRSKKNRRGSATNPSDSAASGSDDDAGDEAEERRRPLPTFTLAASLPTTPGNAHQGNRSAESRGAAAYLPPLCAPAVSPRQYTAADPPAIVTGRHTKPQLSPRVNLNTANTARHPSRGAAAVCANGSSSSGAVSARPANAMPTTAVADWGLPAGTAAKQSRAAFGTIFLPEAPKVSVMSAMDACGAGGTALSGRSIGGPSRVVRGAEDARLMSGDGRRGGAVEDAWGGYHVAHHQQQQQQSTNHYPLASASALGPIPSLYHHQTTSNNGLSSGTSSHNANANNRNITYSTGRSERYSDRLKFAVTPDLPEALEGDPQAELDAFDALRALQAGPDGSGKVHRLLSNPNMQPLPSTEGTAKAKPSLFGGIGRSTVPGGLVGNGRRDMLEETLDGPTAAANASASGGSSEQPLPNDVGACKRDYQLTKVIFRAAKVHDTYPCRLLRGMGEAQILARHQAVVRRLGYRRLNREEFQNHIGDIVGAAEGSVTRRDTDAIFDLFDTNSSGFLDDREIVSGFHWIMQGPDETRRIIAAYCKQFLAARNVMEAVVSLMEVEIMAKAVCETCEGRYPGVTQDAINIVGFLANHARLGQVSSLSGFVPYPLFFQVVQRSPIFGKVIRVLKIDGTLPPELPRTRSADPAREIGTMVHIAETLVEGEEGRRGGGREQRGGGGAGQSLRNTTASAPGSGGQKKNGSGSDGSAGGATHNADDDGDDGGGDGDAGSGGLGGTGGSSRGLFDCAHPRFRADMCAQPPGYRPTPEHDSPVWALRNGVLWLTNPTEAPQLNTRKASMLFK